MPELRWTLLILGALFIAALAWWELRKPRQARRGDVDLRSSHPTSVSRDTDIETPTRVYREPTISLPDVRPRTMSTTELPIIEVKDDTMIGLRIDGEDIEEEVREMPPIADEAILPSEREPTSSRETLLAENTDWRIDDDERDITWTDEPSVAKSEKPFSVPKPLDEAFDSSEEFSTELDGSELREVSKQSAPPLSLTTPEHAEPKVEWPDDGERVILALRLVSSGDRFPGRALRQALMSEGFALGKMDIFHKAGLDGRVIVSAAGLTRPGTFSLDTIDTQRFTGLNLFAVLPGPLSGSETFEELLSTARAMNERLRGGLQDDTGQPLTPARVAAIRSTLPDTPALPPLDTAASPPNADGFDDAMDDGELNATAGHSSAHAEPNTTASRSGAHAELSPSAPSRGSTSAATVAPASGVRYDADTDPTAAPANRPPPP